MIVTVQEALQMKMTLSKILPGILLVTFATPGFAENRQGAVTVSPFVGGYVLDHKQHEESRPLFGMRAGYNFTRNLGAEAMFGYSLTETKIEYGSRETDMYRYGFDFLYHFMPDRNLVPFIAVGGGGTSFQTPNTPSAQNHHAGLVNYGGGLKYFIADNVAFRGDVRHVLLIDDLGKHNLEYSLGLTFQMGGVKKKTAAVADTVIADTTPPTVTFTSPANGGSAMPVNQKINAAFSEKMDTRTFSGSTFTVKQGKEQISGKMTGTDSTVTFIPANDLEKGKEYTATISTGVKDLAGNAIAQKYDWTFTTGQAADTTAPTVIFTSPVNGATAAPVKQQINAAFSENIDPATITAATFTVTQGTVPVSGKVTSAGSNAAFTPDTNFGKGKVYRATITTGARDLAGNPLAKNYVWEFTAFSITKVVAVLATLENSHFDYNKAEISENGKTILNHNLKTLKADPKIKIRVSGYTSAAGSEEYNQQLSERRAAAVKDYLVKTGGVNGSRITTIGYGETQPAQHEADPTDKLSAAALANMRVVVEVIEE